LLIVVAIALIVAAMAVPSMSRVRDNYRLKSSAQSVSNLLQQAKMAAIEANRPYYVQANAGVVPNLVTASPLESRGYVNSDPTARTGANVAFQVALLPDHVQLDNYLGGAGAVIQPAGAVIAFNARGQPCVSPAGPSFVCQGPAAFEWFMQSNSTQAWVAITVTPAGRVRSWRLASPGVWN
jgi:Tfp pilus assembly protein FimT